jgi:hypothetical protein
MRIRDVARVPYHAARADFFSFQVRTCKSSANEASGLCLSQIAVRILDETLLGIGRAAVVGISSLPMQL